MKKHNILVTGGCGFIGSHVIRKLLVHNAVDYDIVNVDKLTYAGNVNNLTDIENVNNYHFECVDICDKDNISRIFEQYEINGVIHLAAESHVDNSIKDPFTFANTNVLGTLTLLQCAKEYWESLPEKYEGKKFYHISTDEVYGALTMDKNTFFTESTKYNPHSPYSASKASSDHFVRAFHDTYGMPINISNCSNNYGPYQFPEKLIPLAIHKLQCFEKIPIYGTGTNVRDWLYVEDHADAIDLIFHNGKDGETYNIGGNNEKTNFEIIKTIIKEYAKYDEGVYNREVYEYVTDRKGHDLRYAINSNKLQAELGWKPKTSFEEGMEKTVKWYADNVKWYDNIFSGQYKIDNDKYRTINKKFTCEWSPEFEKAMEEFRNSPADLFVQQQLEQKVAEENQKLKDDFKKQLIEEIKSDFKNEIKNEILFDLEQKKDEKVITNTYNANHTNPSLKDKWFIRDLDYKVERLEDYPLTVSTEMLKCSSLKIYDNVLSAYLDSLKIMKELKISISSFYADRIIKEIIKHPEEKDKIEKIEKLLFVFN